MAWKAVYEDLSTYTDASTDYRDLPVDGLQAVVLDGVPCCGFDCCGFATIDRKDAVLIPKIVVRESELKTTYPTAHIVRTCNTSTRQFHKVEKLVGLWSLDNKKYEPHEGWEKDVIGWRLWTETEVFDSKGIPESEWFDLWEMLPSTGLQLVVLYENWKAPDGSDYQQMVAGRDYCYMLEGPYGPVWGKDDDLALIKQRYPAASVKTGTQMPDAKFAKVLAKADAARVF